MSKVRRNRVPCGANKSAPINHISVRYASDALFKMHGFRGRDIHISTFKEILRENSLRVQSTTASRLMFQAAHFQLKWAGNGKRNCKGSKFSKSLPAYGSFWLLFFFT